MTLLAIASVHNTGLEASANGISADSDLLKVLGKW